MNRFEEILTHYELFFGTKSKIHLFDKGPIEELAKDFRVLEFEPTKERPYFTYATACMSNTTDESPIDIFIYSPIATQEVVELLFMIAHFHRTSKTLRLSHTMFLGKSWIKNSKCDYILFSTPYLEEIDFESMNSAWFVNQVSFCWIIPITKQELEFKKQMGLEALEILFEERNFNYLDIDRPSLISDNTGFY